MPSSCEYRVRIVPEHHEIEVELRLAGLPPGPLRVLTPTWVPGAYGFMKYGRDLFDVTAADPATGAALPAARDGWSGFVVDGAKGQALVRFRAYAFDAAWGELVGFVGHDQALLLATHLLFAPAHQGPCRVEYLLPAGWALHHPASARRVGESAFEYASFAALLDTPVAAGRFDRRTRDVAGTPFHFVFFERALGFEQRAEAFLDGVVRIAEACRAIFGAFPFPDYTFLLTFDPNAKWGLEHADGTTIALDEDLFTDDDSWQRGLRVCAHELFHAWNVCRLKPAPLGAPDFERGSFPDGLWVSEGVTRYYEFLLLARAGVITPQVFFSNVVNFYQQLDSHPAARRVSLLDSSRATFLNHNKYPGSVNATIDYYDAGMLVAFDLDVALRAVGDSLDEAFAGFYAAHAGRGDGFRHADAARFFGERAAGVRELLEREVARPGGYGVVASLERVGFEVVRSEGPYLGLVLSEKLPAEIANVTDDGPAAQSGIGPGDVIERVNGFPFKPKALAWATANLPRVQLQVRRGSRAVTFEVAPGRRREVRELKWAGSAAQAEQVARWLGRPDFAPQKGERFSLASYENFHGIQKVV